MENNKKTLVETIQMMNYLEVVYEELSKEILENIKDSNIKYAIINVNNNMLELVISISYNNKICTVYINEKKLVKIECNKYCYEDYNIDFTDIIKSIKLFFS